MAKLKDLPLDELYKRPRITGATLEAILIKEDFTKQSVEYCDKVCDLECKTPQTAFRNVSSRQADVIFVQNHVPVDEKYKEGYKIDRKNQQIMQHAVSRCLPNGITTRWVNLLKCPVQRHALKGRSSLKAKTISKCSPYAIEEIKAARPKLVVATTTEAVKILGFPKKSVTKNLSEIHWSPVVNAPVLFTLHPRLTTMIRQNASGGMWGHEYYGLIEQDLRNAAKFLRGEFSLIDLADALKEAKTRIFIPKTLDEVKYYCFKLRDLAEKGSILSWDLETTGLDPWAPTAKILTCQFGWRDKASGKSMAVVFPLWHRRNVFYDPNKAWGSIAELISNPIVKKIGHNIKYDITYTAVTTGVRAKGIVLDTMLLIHSINSGVSGAYGLKQAVWRYIPESRLGGYEDEMTVEEDIDDDEEDVE